MHEKIIMKHIFKIVGPGMMVHVYNSRYSGGSLGKEVNETPFQQISQVW
jgi:hypothetical protein